jgi:exodeoxyribonuclease VII large subunit
MQLGQRLDHAGRSRLTREQLRLVQLGQRLVTPIHAVRRAQQHLDALDTRARHAVQGSLVERRLDLARIASSLAHLNPEGVLARGYSIVQRDDGAVVRDAASLAAGDTLRIRFHRGQARATVESARGED